MNKERNICIVGLGLLGGSYAMGLTGAGYTVTAVDVRPEAIRYAVSEYSISGARKAGFKPAHRCCIRTAEQLSGCKLYRKRQY